MSDDYIDDCGRCGRPIKDHHSHVMVVPIGRGRRFYHASCGPKRSRQTTPLESQQLDRDSQEAVEPKDRRHGMGQ
jgi:hypothetical protein